MPWLNSKVYNLTRLRKTTMLLFILLRCIIIRVECAIKEDNSNDLLGMHFDDLTGEELFKSLANLPVDNELLDDLRKLANLPDTTIVLMDDSSSSSSSSNSNKRNSHSNHQRRRKEPVVLYQVGVSILITKI